MPTVYRRLRPDGRSSETFTAEIWIDGKKFSRSTGCRTRRAAEKAAAQREAELRRKVARRHDPLTLDTLMGRFWVEHAGRLPSANSVKYHILRLLEILGHDLTLADMSNSDLNRYVTRRATMGVSNATINRELDVLRSAYCMARDRWEHPVRAIRWKDHRFPADEEERDCTLSLEEAREAIRLAASRSQDVADGIELTIYTGVRKNELALTKASVNLAERKATVLAKRKARQGFRKRTVFLSTAAVALLTERIKPEMDPDAPLFDLANHRKVWEWVRKEIGRPEVRWHDLRHTHGTLLGKTTDNARIIQKSLGHTHLETTLRYVHTDHAQVREAVETIPPLSDRKLVVLRPEADNVVKPPASTASSGTLASEKPPANTRKSG